MGFCVWSSWWASAKSPNHPHGLLALRATNGNRLLWRGGRGERGQHVEKGADAGEFVLRRRALPPVGAHPPQPLGQDVLEEPGDEDGHRQNGGPLLAGFRVFVAERDMAVAFFEVALRAHGRAVDVAREVFECVLPAPDRFAVHDPRLAPEATLDLVEERGGAFAQSALEAGAHPHTEHLHAKQVIRILRRDQDPILPQRHAGNDVVDVRVIHELAAPGVECAQEPGFAAQLGGCNILHRGRAFAEQDVEHQSLVGADDRAQLLGHGERDQVIRHRQEPGGLALQPLLRFAVPALWAGPVTAAVIGEVPVPAFAVVEASAALRRMARKDRAHRRVVRGQDVLGAVPGHVGRPVTTEDVRQCRGHRGLRLDAQAGVEGFERLSRPILAHAREVGVNDRRFDRAMAEVFADERERDPRFQQMRGKAVAQRVDGRPLADPALGHAALEGDLHARLADVVAAFTRRLLRRDLEALPPAPQAGEQPLPVAVQTPERAELGHHPLRHRHVAVFPALGVADVDAQHLGVDVRRRDPDRLPEPQPAVVDQREEHPEAHQPRRPDHRRHLLAREHPRQAFVPPHPHRPPQRPVVPEVVAEERPQRHDRLRHRRRRILALAPQQEQEVRRLPLREPRRVAPVVPRRAHHVREVALLRARPQVFEFDEAPELGYGDVFRIFFS